MKLRKTSLRTQSKQTNLENRLHISRESPKEGFNDTVFQRFMDELKHLIRICEWAFASDTFICYATF